MTRLVLIYGFAFCISIFISGCESKPQAEKSVAESATKRMAFDQLFEVNDNNVKPKTVIRYNGVTFTPEVPFEANIIVINNEPFSQLKGRDAEVKIEGGVTNIIKFY